MTDSIQVISWNILNPDPDFVKMSLRPVVNQSSPEKRDFSQRVYEQSRKLAVINQKRYQTHRKPDILRIIAKWFSDNPTRFVLCLDHVYFLCNQFVHLNYYYVVHLNYYY